MKLEWSYFQLTILNTSNMYKPLEDYIKNKLIPALTGHSCSDLERELFSLPCKLDGIGILHPVTTANINFEDYMNITAPLVEEILNQGMIINQEFLDVIDRMIKDRMVVKIEALKSKQFTTSS